jgi:hypothetical protein
MKPLTTLLLLLCLSNAFGNDPEYFGSKQVIQDENKNTTVPAGNRLYVGKPTEFTKILPYNDKITIRGIIEATTYKDKRVGIVILRNVNGKSEIVHDVVVNSKEDDKFPIHAEDVIWITDPYAPR